LLDGTSAVRTRMDFILRKLLQVTRGGGRGGCGRGGGGGGSGGDDGDSRATWQNAWSAFFNPIWSATREKFGWYVVFLSFVFVFVSLSIRCFSHRRGRRRRLAAPAAASPHRTALSCFLQGGRRA